MTMPRTNRAASSYQRDLHEPSQWDVPVSSILAAAYGYLCDTGSSTITQTPRYKLGGVSGLSRIVETVLLWAQIVATNMTSALLGAVWSAIKNPESPLQPHILQKLEEKAQRARERAQQKLQQKVQRAKAQTRTKRTRRVVPKPKKSWLPGELTDTFNNMLSTYFSHRAGFTAHDYPLVGTLRHGVFWMCARMVLGWEQDVREDWVAACNAAKEAKVDSAIFGIDRELASSDQKTFPDLWEAYRMWKRRQDAYDSAARTPFPFQPHRDIPLGEIRKRALPYLISQFPSHDVIKRTISALNVLLDPHAKPSERKAARKVRHPWWRSRQPDNPRTHRHLRASPFVQYHNKLRSRPVTLGRMSHRQLQLLHMQLSELLLFEGQFAKIQAAVLIVQQGPPPSFPSVKPVEMDAPPIESETNGHGRTPSIHERVQTRRLHLYQTDLDWFQDPWPSNAHLNDLEHYLPETLVEIERNKQGALQSSARDLQVIKLQPLTFLRVIRPKGENIKLGSFALLYAQRTQTMKELIQKYRRLPWSQRLPRIQQELGEGEIYEYRLAVTVRGKDAPEIPSDEKTEDKAPANRKHPGKRPGSTKLPRPDILSQLHYVDSPMTPYLRSLKTHHHIIPLQFGEQQINSHSVQGEQLLRRVVNEQQEAQQTRLERLSQEGKAPLTIEACLPKAAIAMTYIVAETNADGRLEFFLCPPISINIPPATPARTTMGVHLHGGRPAFAVIGLDGTILDVGEVTLPRHVRAADADEYRTENEVYETAHALVRLATRYNAYIGIERTSYLKQHPSLNRRHNRRLHARPDRKLTTILTDKARLTGRAKPLEVHSVSPTRDCGYCGGGRAEGETSVKLQRTESCYADRCQSPHVHPYLYIPTMVGAIAIGYNLPRVGQLNLSGTTLADMFLGRIVAWNDTRIAADNPGMTLPDQPIVIITRKGPAGTTHALTSYLSRMSLAWKERIGMRADVGWPIGCSFTDDRAISREIARTEGAIGFTALAYAREQRLAVACIENTARQFIQPTEEALIAATEGALGSRYYDLRTNLVTKRLRSTAYPLTTFSYIVLPENRLTRSKAVALSDFLYWVMTHGSEVIGALGYVPLPTNVRLRAVACLALIRANGQYIFHPPEIVPTAEGAAVGWNHQHEVRAVQTKLLGAGAGLPAPIYARLIADYQKLAPQVAINYSATGSDYGFEAFAGRDTDFCGIDFCPTTEVIHTHINEDDSLVCLSCGCTWNAFEPHFSCGRCGARLLARFNTAIATARRTQQQAVDYAQRLRALRAQDGAEDSES